MLDDPLANRCLTHSVEEGEGVPPAMAPAATCLLSSPCRVGINVLTVFRIPMLHVIPKIHSVSSHTTTTAVICFSYRTYCSVGSEHRLSSFSFCPSEFRLVDSSGLSHTALDFISQRHDLIPVCGFIHVRLWCTLMYVDMFSALLPVFRYNVGRNCEGAGVRLGGHVIEGFTYGVDNHVSSA